MGRPCINRGRSATKQSDEEQDYSKWDPVKWFSQRGYNVTQMIHAPGNCNLCFKLSFFKKIKVCEQLKIASDHTQQ